MKTIREDHMNMIVKKAVSKWHFSNVYDDLVQIARIAYWESCNEDDPDYVMVTKVRRRTIDGWRRLSGRSKYRFECVEIPEEKYHPAIMDQEYFSIECLNLPEKHSLVVSYIASGLLKSEVAELLGITPSRISQILAETRRILDSR